jgi:hypothetical protein
MKGTQKISRDYLPHTLYCTVFTFLLHFRYVSVPVYRYAYLQCNLSAIPQILVIDL